MTIILNESTIVTKSIPCQKNIIGIYFLIHKNKVVYVGQSSCVPARIGTHIKEQTKDFDRYHVIKCQKHELNEIEAEYIYAYNPIYNTAAPISDNINTLGRLSNTYGVGLRPVRYLVEHLMGLDYTARKTLVRYSEIVPALLAYKESNYEGLDGMKSYVAKELAL